jgi:hypothetical protein
MKVPKVFLGRGVVISKRMNKFVQVLKSGEELADEDFGPFVDTREFPGASLLIDQVNRKEPGEHFHCYRLFDAVAVATDFQNVDGWFPWFLRSEWRFLCVLSVIVQFLAHPKFESLREQYLEAAYRFGPLLDNEGERFRYISTQARFSQIESGVSVVLRRLSLDLYLDGPGGVLEALRVYFSSSSRN